MATAFNVKTARNTNWNLWSLPLQFTNDDALVMSQWKRIKVYKIYTYYKIRFNKMELENPLRGGVCACAWVKQPPKPNEWIKNYSEKS